MIFIDYSIHQECQNEEVYYTCYKCGKCGRVFDENGIMIKQAKDEKELEE
jgi:hypothetical protein